MNRQVPPAPRQEPEQCRTIESTSYTPVQYRDNAADLQVYVSFILLTADPRKQK